MENEIVKINDKNFVDLYKNISSILRNARENVYKAVNFVMVQSYWSIGQLIVEDEQKGETRAEYGKAVLGKLSLKLTEEFGKGFDERELRKMRQFYQEFQIRDSLRPELTWSHYRMLLRVKDEKARNWYMNEAADQTWSTRPVLAEAKQIFASKYELALPKPEELEHQIKMNRLLIEEQMKNNEEDEN